MRILSIAFMMFIISVYILSAKLCAEVCYFPSCATDVLKDQLEISNLYHSLPSPVSSSLTTMLRRIYMSNNK